MIFDINGLSFCDLHPNLIIHTVINSALPIYPATKMRLNPKKKEAPGNFDHTVVGEIRRLPFPPVRTLSIGALIYRSSDISAGLGPENGTTSLKTGVNMTISLPPNPKTW